MRREKDSSERLREGYFPLAGLRDRDLDLHRWDARA